MSSTGLIRINEANQLSIPTYSFITLLERVAEYLNSLDPELREEIEAAISGLPVISIEELDDKRFKQLCQATHHAIDNMLAQMDKDDRYAGYISVLSDACVLQMMLNCDPRAALDLSGASTVIINQASRWQVEEWIGAFLSMQMIILGVARQQVEWVSVLKIGWQTHKQIDLSLLSEKEFHIMIMSFQSTIHNYKYLNHVSSDLAVFDEQTSELLQVFLNDPRAKNYSK
jgi:hypothetical protein